MDPLVVSQILSWIVILVLAAVVLALARQVGILHERVAPLGALNTHTAVEVGQKAPEFGVLTLEGEPLHLGGQRPDGRSQLLLFVSPSCPMCKKLLPVARSFARSERKSVEIVLMGDGDRASHEKLLQDYRAEGMALAIAPIVGINLGIGRLPYAVLVDRDGVIRSKGIVNSREHLESLLVAQETGYGSMQDYLVGAAPAPGSGALRGASSMTTQNVIGRTSA